MRQIVLYAFIIIAAGCTTTRSITNSGKVTPKGNFVVGGSYAINLPTQTIGSVADLLTSTINDIAKEDTIRTDVTLDKINKAGVAYALDPIDNGFNFYLRYGLFKRIDIGYKRSFGANIFDCQYQFAGSTGYINDAKFDNFYGSVGLQYSSQNISYLSLLKKLDNRIGLSFERKDIMIPFIFSFSFGNEETYGSVSTGLSFTHSWITYSTNPIDIYNIDNTKLATETREQQYSSIGTFLNFRLGYKRVFVIPSLAIYYQKYGEYKLLSEKMITLKGVTFIPALALQVRIGRNQQKSASK